MPRILALLVLAACSSHAPAPTQPTPVAVGVSVSEALARCKAVYADVVFLDEPPGKLRGVSFECRDGTPRQIELHLEYTTELFSAERAWPEALVGRQRVTAAHWR